MYIQCSLRVLRNAAPAGPALSTKLRPGSGYPAEVGALWVMLNYAGEYCEYGEYCDAGNA